jgi:hypothetical protein
MTTKTIRPTELASDLKAIEAIEQAYGLTNPPADSPTLCSATGELYADALSHQSRRLIMKLTITACAIALLATQAISGGLSGPIAEGTPTPAAYSGPTLYALCTNVPARSGSVAGFQIRNLPANFGSFVDGSQLDGSYAYFVEETSAPYATHQRIAGIIPAGLSSKDDQDVANYLASIGLTDVILVTRPDRDERVVEEEVVAERGVSDGSMPSGDNLTSMGNAVSDGATILRVRSTVAQDVKIRKAGGGTVIVSVEAGDTLVAVDGVGTYIADFLGTNVSKTKATGPQDFNDVSTVDVVVRTSSDGEWCK